MKALQPAIIRSTTLLTWAKFEFHAKVKICKMGSEGRGKMLMDLNVDAEPIDSQIGTKFIVGRYISADEKE